MSATVDYARPDTDMRFGRGGAAAKALAKIAAASGVWVAVAVVILGGVWDGEALQTTLAGAAALATATLGAAWVGLVRQRWTIAALLGPPALAAGCVAPGLFLADVTDPAGGLRWDNIGLAALAAVGALPGLALTAAAGCGRASRLGPTRLGGWWRMAVALGALVVGGGLVALTQFKPPPPAYGMAEWSAKVRAFPPAELPVLKGPLTARATGRTMAVELGVPEAGDALGDALAWAAEYADAKSQRTLWWNKDDWLVADAAAWRGMAFTPGLRLREARAAGEPLPGEGAAGDAGEPGDAGSGSSESQFEWPLLDGLPERAVKPWLEQPAGWSAFRRADGTVALPLGGPDAPTIHVRPDGGVTATGTTVVWNPNFNDEITSSFEMTFEPDVRRLAIDGEPNDWLAPGEVTTVFKLPRGEIPAAVVAERVLAVDGALRAAGGPGLQPPMAWGLYGELAHDADLRVIEASPDEFGTLRIAYSDGRERWYAGGAWIPGFQGTSAAGAEAGRVAMYNGWTDPYLPGPLWSYAALAGLALAALVASPWPRLWLVPATLLPATLWWSGAAAWAAWENLASPGLLLLAVAAGVGAAVLALVAAYALVPGWRAAVAGTRRTGKLPA